MTSRFFSIAVSVLAVSTVVLQGPGEATECASAAPCRKAAADACHCDSDSNESKTKASTDKYTAKISARACGDGCEAIIVRIEGNLPDCSLIALLPIDGKNGYYDLRWKPGTGSDLWQAVEREARNGCLACCECCQFIVVMTAGGELPVRVERQTAACAPPADAPWSAGSPGARDVNARSRRSHMLKTP